MADPVPDVVSTEPRPEEGPRVRQRGLLSSDEIWRLQRSSLSIPCQRVRNQRPEDARRPRAAASTWMPCSLPAPGLRAWGGSQAMAALAAGWWSEAPLRQQPGVLPFGCVHSHLAGRAQPFPGPLLPVPTWRCQAVALAHRALT